MIIPLNKFYTTGRELEYMQDCLASQTIAANGFYTGKVQELISQTFDCPRVLLTTSATAALEMACLLLNLQPGDEVILPSFTFVSTANAVLLRGAHPVFAEIDPYTLNLDPDDLCSNITPHTRAIMPVHYAGTACDMGAIMKAAHQYGLPVIEDAAQAVNAKYQDKYLGTIGDLGCFSFHGTKNLVCGEGGALLIKSNKPELLERAEIVWEKGTNRGQFLRGQVDKYTWTDIGSSYAPSDLLAAFLYAQLESMNAVNAAREKVYQYYYTSLQPYARQGLFRLPEIPAWASPNYHIFYLLFNSGSHRNQVMRELRSQGIEASFHFIPLHSSPMGQRLGYKPDDLPVTEKISSCLLRLPIYPQISTDEQAYVIKILVQSLHNLR